MYFNFVFLCREDLSKTVDKKKVNDDEEYLLVRIWVIYLFVSIATIVSKNNVQNYR